jgi:hypothetical protein
MSRKSVQIILSILISLGVILAVYTTVLGAPLGFVGARMGSHLVSGAMTNFNHYRLTAAEQQTYQAQLDAYYNSQTSPGHDCGSQSFSNPDD